MKKISIGLFMLGLVFFGSGLISEKVSAGALSNTQISNVLNQLSQYNVSPTVQMQISSLLSSANATPTTNTTTIALGCGYGPFNVLTSASCPYPVTPNSTTPTTGSGVVNPNSSYPYGTTPTTPTTPTPTTTGQNYCVSSANTFYAFNISNGYQCVKICPTSSASLSNIPTWNFITNSMCPSITPTPHPTNSATSITVISPNGGEVYAPGDIVGVEWSSMNIPDTNEGVYIILSYPSTSGGTLYATELVTHTLNDGGQKVILPTTFTGGALGNNFTITVGAVNTNNALLAEDSSNSTFTIQ